MNVSLSPELEDFIRDSVLSGRYRSASEVVRDALRLLRETDRERRLREVRQKSKMRELMRDVVKRPLIEEIDPSAT